MKKFYIEVTETFQRIVSVTAEDLDEAMQKTEDWANEGEGLTYEDFVTRNFDDVTDRCQDREQTMPDLFFNIDKQLVNKDKVIKPGDVEYGIDQKGELRIYVKKSLIAQICDVSADMAAEMVDEILYEQGYIWEE